VAALLFHSFQSTDKLNICNVVGIELNSKVGGEKLSIIAPWYRESEGKHSWWYHNDNKLPALKLDLNSKE
jgi:hypothetical protein